MIPAIAPPYLPGSGDSNGEREDAASGMPIGDYAAPPRMDELNDAILRDILGFDAASTE